MKLYTYKRLLLRHVELSLLTLLLASCTGINSNQTPFPVNIESPTIRTTETSASIETTQTKELPLISTPIPTSTIYDFPLWMSNPKTTILAALFRNDLEQTRNIIFFNATTGEKYELNPTLPFGGFYWHDNMNFGLLAKDLNTAYQINLQTGQVQTKFISTQSTRFLNKDWVNGLNTFTEPASDELTFDDSWKTNKSLNKQYTAQWSYNEYSSEKGLIVTNTNTDQVVWEISLPENKYGTEFIWSPVNENHLAFLQGSPKGDFITEDMILTIVDVSKGEILTTYKGDFGIIEWSPDEKKILYLDPSFRYRNYGISFKDSPCLLILGTGEKKCLRSIPRTIPTGYELLTTGVYEWASDSNSIYYTYLYSLPSQWNILGNLCNYSLVDSHINCPTQSLEVLQGRSIISYDFSPDKQFIHFCYSASTILNDYADIADDGIIRVDGSGFFSWVGTIQDGGPQSCSIETLWRPLP